MNDEPGNAELSPTLNTLNDELVWSSGVWPSDQKAHLRSASTCSPTTSNLIFLTTPTYLIVRSALSRLCGGTIPNTHNPPKTAYHICRRHPPSARPPELPTPCSVRQPLGLTTRSSVSSPFRGPRSPSARQVSRVFQQLTIPQLRRRTRI